MSFWKTDENVVAAKVLDKLSQQAAEREEARFSAFKASVMPLIESIANSAKQRDAAVEACMEANKTMHEDQLQKFGELHSQQMTKFKDAVGSTIDALVRDNAAIQKAQLDALSEMQQTQLRSHQGEMDKALALVAENADRQQRALVSCVESSHKDWAGYRDAYADALIRVDESRRVELAKKEKEENDRIDKDRQKAACALNMCMVSLSQIIDYEDCQILKMEYESILNNLNLEKIVKDEPILKALQAIMDACHFYILHAKDKEMLRENQQARLKGALGKALGGGNVIAVFGSGNPWAIAAGAVAMIGVAAVNYKSELDRAKLENKNAEWQLERTALEQLHNLRRTLFETAWRFAEKYNYPDSYRLTEKQIAIYNDIIKNPDPQTRYESLWLIRDNFKAYPIFWYYLGRAALETSDAFRDDRGKNVRKRQLAYGPGDPVLCASYRKKAKEAYDKFKACHIGNELMREDVIAASAYLDHAQLLDSEDPTPEDLAQIFDDVNRAHELARMDSEVVQSCAFRYLQLYGKRHELSKAIGVDGKRSLDDEAIRSIPVKAAECLRFLVDRDFNPEINGRALSRLYKLENNKDEFEVAKSIISRRCPFVYQRYFPWDAACFKCDWDAYLGGSGLKRSAFNFFYGSLWMSYKDFFCALQEAKQTRNYASLKNYREYLIATYKRDWETCLHNPGLEKDENGKDKIVVEIVRTGANIVSAVSNPIGYAISLVLTSMRDEDRHKADESLTGLMLQLLDKSFERDGWRLFLGTRAARFAPNKFEAIELKLMAKLLSDAKSLAKKFAEDFKNDSEKEEFSYEAIEKVGKDAKEPNAFQAIDFISKEAERLRLEIQELLGEDKRFWYPDPEFPEDYLYSQSDYTKRVVEGMKRGVKIGLEFVKGICVKMNENVKEGLSDEEIARAKERGLDVK